MSAHCPWCRGGLEMSTGELSKFDTKPLRHPYELRISSSNQTPLLQSEYYIDKELQEDRQHCAEPECRWPV